MHEILVSELKEELGVEMFKNQEEEYESQEEANLGIDNMHEIIENAFDVEALKDCYVGGFVKGKDIREELKKKAKCEEEEVERKLAVEREEQSELDDCASESEWDSSEDENEHEHGVSFGELFDGQLCM